MTKKAAVEQDMTITKTRAIKALLGLRRAELASAHSGELLGEYHRLVEPKTVRLVDGPHVYRLVPTEGTGHVIAGGTN